LDTLRPEMEIHKEQIRSQVLSLVARYLIATKASSTSLLDPIAKFH